MSPFLDPARQAEHRRRNLLHSSALILGMGLLMAVSAWLVWSWAGLAIAFGSLVFALLLAPSMTPEFVMSLYRAVPVDTRHGAQLLHIVEVLADRAELPAHPRLYVIPSGMLNAFATGTPERSAIAVTEGLLRRLTMREMSGVLAHEISHIRNRDLGVMALADVMTRFTQMMAYLALILAALNIPAIILDLPTTSWIAILLLYLAPTISSQLQLALSRSREFDADLEAAGLTGDPLGLASALRALDRNQGRFWEDLMYPVPGRRVPQPSVLRSHPATDDRIRRLTDLVVDHGSRRIEIVDEPQFSLIGLGPAGMAPRHRWPGLWY